MSHAEVCQYDEFLRVELLDLSVRIRFRHVLLFFSFYFVCVHACGVQRLTLDVILQELLFCF